MASRISSSASSVLESSLSRPSYLDDVPLDIIKSIFNNLSNYDAFNPFIYASRVRLKISPEENTKLAMEARKALIIASANLSENPLTKIYQLIHIADGYFDLEIPFEGFFDAITKNKKKLALYEYDAWSLGEKLKKSIKKRIALGRIDEAEALLCSMNDIIHRKVHIEILIVLIKAYADVGHLPKVSKLAIMARDEAMSPITHSPRHFINYRVVSDSAEYSTKALTKLAGDFAELHMYKEVISVFQFIKDFIRVHNPGHLKYESQKEFCLAPIDIVKGCIELNKFNRANHLLCVWEEIVFQFHHWAVTEPFQIEALTEMANGYIQLGNHTKALDLLERSEKLLKHTRPFSSDARAKIETYTRVAKGYAQLGVHDKVKGVLNNCKALIEKEREKNMFTHLLNEELFPKNIVAIAKIFIEKGDTIFAEALLQDAEDFTTDADVLHEIPVYKDIAEAYIYLNKLDKVDGIINLVKSLRTGASYETTNFIIYLAKIFTQTELWVNSKDLLKDIKLINYFNNTSVDTLIEVCKNCIQHEKYNLTIQFLEVTKQIIKHHWLTGKPQLLEKINIIAAKLP
ncbi:MAG: hypothetical protein COT84_01585 [Chlamydiae bacterium CG10_big_fil_rev_8_21_14_0_10_35_9]|nr:MAG: hypothetical protein COT84_01585 [Chlamydiae bacterium CG10_big_fil_rev_8_21_14_0_10_35_9]